MEYHANSVALLPPKEREAWLNSLTPVELEYLDYDWQFWARKEQLPPSGEWHTWLILAGRGAGKTRTGGEWVKANVCGSTPLGAGKYSRIALIAETAADARDVVVEGESGLLAIHHKDFRPQFTPSKRRLTWPNGAVATLYNATEPDQLRGPQHDAAWCLSGDTLVSMADGSRKRIDTVVPGNLVLTRKGARKVVASAMTKPSAQTWKITCVGGQTIEATQDHAIYCTGKWVPVRDLKKGDRLCAIGALSGADTGGIHTARITSGLISRLSQNAIFGSIARWRRSSSAQIWTALTFITGTKTFCTTQPTTLRRSFMASTEEHISLERQWRFLKRRSVELSPIFAAGRLLNMSVQTVKAFFALKPQMHAFALSSASNRGGLLALSQRCGPAPSVAVSLSRRSVFNAFAARHVTFLFRETLSIGRKSPVLIAGRLFCKREEIQDSAQGSAPSVTTVAIKSVEPSRIQPVYDLAIDGEPEFFANGILVHNCDELAKWRYAQETWDMLQFGLRLGDDPRQVITTTPRPIPIIRDLMRREGQDVAVTRGSTYANQANLADAFIKQLKNRYDGTRLGRQELNAEILDDVPWALWTRSNLDQHRRKITEKLPDMQRIVVAIDPAAKGNETPEDGAETGIIVAGVGVDGRGYVLDDLSCRLSPMGWARMAISGFDRYSADAVVAEINQGGDMVEAVLRAERPTAPIIKVHASRGKVTRAEPIAALYEQGRISHIGCHATLEDQMVLFTPNGIMGETTADRVDALVWALTQLFPSIVNRDETNWEDVFRTPSFHEGGGWMKS